MAENQQTVLIVDDTLVNIDILKSVLCPHYAIKIATNGELALKIVDKQPPDLIILDIIMPDMDGYEVCRRLKSNETSAKIPIIFVTSKQAANNEQACFDLGAVDYITKPIRPAIVIARVKAQLELADQHLACEMMVALRTKELVESQNDAIMMLARAGHFNDTDTGVHIWRMAEYAKALARAAQWTADAADLLSKAAPMHDMGKIGIPDSILKAPRKLTTEEWTIMKSHSEVGHGILSLSKMPLFSLAAEIALAHHEKWDGSGYPQGLQGNAIPESAQIVAIADVFDALTMKRPYKDAWSVDKALDVMLADVGSHFDERLIKLFISIKDEIVAIKSHWDNKKSGEIINPQNEAVYALDMR